MRGSWFRTSALSPSPTSTDTTSFPTPRQSSRCKRSGRSVKLTLAHWLNLGSLFQINITRYPAPYTSECVSDWSATNYSDFLPWDDFYYTLSQCQRFCLQSSFQQICDCYHPYFLDYDANRRGKQACDLENDDAACTEDVVYLLDQGGAIQILPIMIYAFRPRIPISLSSIIL